MIFLLILINVVFAIDPSSEYLKTPKDYNLKFSEVKVKTDDKAELKDRKSVV